MPRTLKNTPAAEKSRQAYAQKKAEVEATWAANDVRRAPIQAAIRSQLQELVSAGYDNAQIHQAFLSGQDLFGVKALTQDEYTDFFMAVIGMYFGGDCPEGRLKACLLPRTGALRRGTYSEAIQAECADCSTRWEAATQVRVPRVPRCNAAARANKSADLDFLTARDAEYADGLAA